LAAHPDFVQYPAGKLQYFWSAAAQSASDAQVAPRLLVMHPAAPCTNPGAHTHLSALITWLTPHGVHSVNGLVSVALTGASTVMGRYTWTCPGAQTQFSPTSSTSPGPQRLLLS
jgi:hypothetical protein